MLRYRVKPPLLLRTRHVQGEQSAQSKREADRLCTVYLYAQTRGKNRSTLPPCLKVFRLGRRDADKRADSRIPLTMTRTRCVLVKRHERGGHVHFLKPPQLLALSGALTIRRTTRRDATRAPCSSCKFHLVSAFRKFPQRATNVSSKLKIDQRRARHET